jgi:hypothetical protein
MANRNAARRRDVTVRFIPTDNGPVFFMAGGKPRSMTDGGQKAIPWRTICRLATAKRSVLSLFFPARRKVISRSHSRENQFTVCLVCL